MKKFLVLLLLICMSFSVFSGCKKSKEKEQQKEKANVSQKDTKADNNSNNGEQEDITDTETEDSEELSDEDTSDINTLIDNELETLRNELCKQRLETEDLSKYGDVSQEFADVVCTMTYDKITFEKSDLVYDGQKVSTQVTVSIPKLEFDLTYIASMLSFDEVIEFYKLSETATGEEFENLMLEYYTIALNKMPLTPKTIDITVENTDGEWQIASGMDEVENYIKGE